ncbi:nuclear transport factor 2 family protein [Ovoidimarina sediminis]|uniref:nuclear transport factor 2 family protein n=1 Tax=Ovoidimarina sediminis TaxID=3079856 RepID=UPI002915A10B|nr:nuclear transport factor 2 family protein [Rhodophyticola sp. MJ-SS7]MDU8945577.1 nuclear transport factor 2 family protein [Rhodophyticola sp. MJ-SS7]
MDSVTEAAIRETVATYVMGMTFGDAGQLRAAFHPRGVSAGHFGGALEWMGVEAFAEDCAAHALPAGAEVPAWEIEMIRTSGDTAVVIVTNVWAGEKFRDTLTLLEEDGRWRIVFKCFHHLA